MFNFSSLYIAVQTPFRSWPLRIPFIDNIFFTWSLSSSFSSNETSPRGNLTLALGCRSKGRGYRGITRKTIVRVEAPMHRSSACKCNLGHVSLHRKCKSKVSVWLWVCSISKKEKHSVKQLILSNGIDSPHQTTRWKSRWQFKLVACTSEICNHSQFSLLCLV